MSSIVKLIFVAVAAVLCAISFFAGILWGEKNMLSKDRYILTRDIDVHVPPTGKGTLPAGTTLYQFQVLGETTQYFAFVGLKERNVLVQDSDSRAMVAPLSATPKE
jgi:hypothetical protein